MMRRVKPAPKPAPVKGKTLILGVLGALFLVVGLLFWAGMTGGSTHVPLSAPGIGFAVDDAGAATASSNGAIGAPDATATWDGAALAQTIHDPKVRDELRRRILAGWAAEGEPEVAAAAKQGRFIPAPVGPDGGRMDPKYIQEVVRGEFFPMAEKCYEELLTRRKGAKGRIEMSFTIVADEKLGGILEDVEADHDDGGLADAKMTTCMRESMASLAFRPPAHGGYVTVVYPIEFAPDDPAESGAGDR
ncbi:MAG: hypothetical protein JWO86_2781 [Myxococcaceae bacterium]|nr:hypothetical protein [Myxococcaceae bacterium]